jgi:riboflavin synthase
MFTGLVETMGTVRAVSAVSAVSAGADGTLLWIADATIAADLPVGASVAVNGVCLTVVGCEGDAFAFQAGPETLRRSNLGELAPGARVNLERALQVGDRLGGHIVQGHVDGIGSIDRRERQGEWETVWFRCLPEVARYLAPKGSIAVDGVSLTLVDVKPDGFSVALIPHTMEATTLGHKEAGASVNLEIDMLAKYVFRCVEQMQSPSDGRGPRS